MRELKMRVPLGRAEEIARLARKAGIRTAISHQVRVHGAEEMQEEVRLKSSTPKVREFLSRLFREPYFDKRLYPFSSHEIRALVDEEPVFSVTRPVYTPLSDLQQDLWQYSHVTTSFVVRAAVSSGLLAYAMLKDDTVLGVGAMIFSPFSPLILAVAFGLASRCGLMIRQGLRALAIALGVTIASAALTAAVAGGPMLFQRFGGLADNFAMSAVIGVLAAVADIDDVGRRQLVGLAMAYPFVKFPTWIGIAVAAGFPERSVALQRLLILGGNAALMTGMAAGVYCWIARRGELDDLPD